MEIERKFLVRQPPPAWKKSPGRTIRQGYFLLRQKNVEIRLRQIGPEHVITVKAGRGKSRLEEEIPISKRQFETLWPLVRDACVVKTRHRLPAGGKVLELDIYERCHRGLVTADVEFRTLRESRAFQAPRWLGREVTGNPRYANATLAQRGRP